MKMNKNLYILVSFLTLVTFAIFFLGTNYISNKHPKLEFKNKTIDLGKVKPDTLYSVVFHFNPRKLNKDQTLSFFSSCGCTIVENSYTKIGENQGSDSLIATVSTRGKQKTFQVYISVINSANEVLDTLIIKGYVL